MQWKAADRMVSDTQVTQLSRRLRNLIEPIAGAVYFAPEVQWEFGRLGLPMTVAAQGASAIEVHRGGAESYGPQYFCSRSACMGQLAGDVVAAVFGYFEPSIVRGAVDRGWSITSPSQILEARLHGTITALDRMLAAEENDLVQATDKLSQAASGAMLASHPIAAGLTSLPLPDAPIGRLWRAADVLREHRGDSHNIAWAARGLSPIEVIMLTELVRGLPLGWLAKTRGWGTEALDHAIDSLRSRSYIDGDEISPAGREAREAIEVATDLQWRQVIEYIEADSDELFRLLHRWSAQILDHDGYHMKPDDLMGPAN